VFAFHLALSGSVGPGGGFAGGGAAAAAVLLYGLIFGVEEARRAAPTLALRIGAAAGFGGLLLLGAIGLVGGYNFFDYHALPGVGLGSARLGAGLAQAGVMLSTACSFCLAFYAIAGRAAELRDEEW
jgi:multicomponent Na+:H+ antiporter subunit B